MRLDRRAFLAAGLAGSAVLAGCTDEEPSETNGDPGSGSGSGAETPVPDADYDRSVEHDLEAWDGYDPDWEPPADVPPTNVEVETVVEGLEVPWDIAVAPDGDLFVSERVGRIVQYDSEELAEVTVPGDVIDHADSIAPGEEDGWWEGGSEGGLMGIAVHPRYPDVPLVYAVYTYQAGEEEYRNRVVHYDVSADDPGETETVVVDAIPGHRIIHNGSRIAFGPANYLWVTTGDADELDLPPDPNSLAGKVLRLEPDGSPAPDNPDLGGDDRVFSVGHRNPQGITFLPDGSPVTTEHGPAARDEVHVLRPGDDHGWGPEEEAARDGGTYPETDFARPVAHSGTDHTWAPSGCVFTTSDAPESFRRRLLFGGLISQQVTVGTIYPRDGEVTPDADGGERHDADWTDEEYDAVTHALLEDELGRVRHVEEGPDGSLYALTSNRDGRAEGDFPIEADDRIVRISPR